MRIAKNTVYLVHVTTSKPDTYGNTYSTVTGFMTIKNAVRQYPEVSFPSVSLHTSNDQEAREFLKSIGYNIERLSDHKNIVVTSEEVTYKRLKQIASNS